MTDFEVVARPEVYRGRTRYPYDEIFKTAETGMAVRIATNGTTTSSVVSALIQAARRRGYKLHARTADGVVIAWVEKREPNA